MRGPMSRAMYPSGTEAFSVMNGESVPSQEV